MRTAIIVTFPGGKPAAAHFEDVVAAKKLFKTHAAKHDAVELWLSDGGRVKSKKSKPPKPETKPVEPKPAVKTKTAHTPHHQ